ncbi:Protein kinase-like (PK-like) [Glarea lozoyensis ATCC 20868]|uniref:Protein kinase-like (PK-like) n=1 Tax=Glarea lozoyensis (strain ATCC 20868 / MF5171) TaxID=1116229 RepID=S3CRZ0_GLAL2|nr:Protein kinase-like (PK-like) [Glarea lozoyensis ATCC 20868]EPE27819.1 Protein kinase-like (PK-like) [Glarea lozoyensis ATCC 20868]
MSYSNGGGGTLTLPSPTHVHHVDVTSAVRSLRRSLSRSPSKFNLVKKSPSSSPKSPLSPSPKSPPKRASSNPTIFTGFSNPPHTPSPLAVPFPPSAKLALRSSGRSKTAPIRPASRRTSPKSPMKRALNQGPDTGNTAPPVLTTWTAGGQENSRSPIEGKGFERSNRMSLNLDSTGPINHALSRLGGEGCSDNPGLSTSSPLKRSDAIMNLDQASLGSPVAKRRSLHGSANFGHDFNVFDHGPPVTSTPQFEIHDDSTPEYELSTASITTDSASAFTSMPRRSSSLRKSTLQQRHGEKTSWGRRHAAQVLAAQQAAAAAAAASNTSKASPEMSTPAPVKNRPRLSLDQFMPPMPRDSPFSSQGNLPSASMHMVNPPTHQPHPLSRTMTTSSSNSSLLDESPTHVPVNFGEQPRPKLDFSKSLPAGSLRPFNFDVSSGHDDSETFSTPQNYKSAKPLPAAFMSTGLISKVNRHPEDEPKISRGGKGNMPDTPCKKHNNIFATYPQNLSGSAIAKARHIRHSFGNPSTPFNPHGSGSASAFGSGNGVFGGGFKGLTRRGSFLSVDGDEDGSPDAKLDSQGSDFELPPTPTKQTLSGSTPYSNNGSPSNHRRLSASMSTVGYGLSKKLTRTSSKLILSASPIQQDAEDSDASMDMNDSPTPAYADFNANDFMSTPSFRNSRMHKRNSTLHSPTPLKMTKSLTVSCLTPSRKPGFAKLSHVAPASPLGRIDFLERLSPRTPIDGILPPDPSGLSISNSRSYDASTSANRSSMPPPATPTAGRGYFPQIGARRLSMTPVSKFPAADVDESIATRFEKVELVGSGEFSHVYRVVQTAPLTAAFAQPFFFGGSGSPSQSRTPPTPMSERVFAVKKARQPYLGNRDRQKKLQEVEVLKALGQSDHVVRFIDSWEDKSYLYIQTEFCEEGSLDVFISQLGRKGRLDDFRIWKVMLEISQGLRYIHDSGFIHLDIKPANILITFEGVLKIGDFGMATSWPAQPGIEGEGDREYIGPEILRGQFDKPADIFALGLMLVEIAANVQLPDNGVIWQRLRSGDMSDIPSLTFSSVTGNLRDATGVPVQDESDITMDSYTSDDDIEVDFGSPSMACKKRSFVTSSKSLSHDPGNLFGSGRRGELHEAPDFMMNRFNEHSLDNIVQGMISENPQDRPTAQQILDCLGVQWVDSRRRAGATVFEGNWGPADEVLADDAEMMDV